MLTVGTVMLILVLPLTAVAFVVLAVRASKGNRRTLVMPLHWNHSSDSEPDSGGGDSGDGGGGD